MKKLLLILIAMLMTGSLFAETVELEGSNPIKYPKVVTPFRLYDDIGDEIRDESQTIIVEETVKGTPVLRDVVGIECPSLDKTSFSAILVVDCSISMNNNIPGSGTRMDVTKDVLKEFANSFDPIRTEIAMVGFGLDALGQPTPNNKKPMLKFTTDRDSVNFAIDNYIGAISAGTNYNAAFLSKNSPYTYIENLSALYYCKKDVAKYKPVIIFLTDGNHVSKGQVKPFGLQEVAEVKNIANNRNATIYVIMIGDEELSDNNKDNLEQLALIGRAIDDTSPNIWLNINNKNQLGNIYQEILTEAGSIGTPPPCYVTWETDCEGGESASFTFPDYGGISESHEYAIDEAKLPNLKITPRISSAFKDVAPGSSDTKTITLKAEKNDIEITNDVIIRTVRGTGKYVVTNWGAKKPPPFTIVRDEVYDIDIEYTPTDSLFSEAVIELEGTACTGREMTISGEMLPFAEDVDMGTVAVGRTGQTSITKLICNKTGGAFEIKSIKITGGDSGEFDVVSPNTPFNLDSAACAEVTFEFSPFAPAGYKESTITIETDYNGGSDFESKIFGNGSGGKTMSSNNPGIDSATCALPIIETEITLINSGNLEIADVVCTIVPDETNFEIKNGDYPTSIAPNSSEPITILFHPTPFQNTAHTATLRVVSDAENTTYDIPLVGPMRNIAFSFNELDFGEVCVSNPETFQLRINNDGNVPFPVDVSVPAPFTVASPNQYLPVGIPVDVDIECAPTSDGDLNEVVRVRNDECDMDVTEAITAMGVEPAISISPTVNLKATIGNTAQVVVTLTNNSAAPLNLTDIIPADSRFTITNFTSGIIPPGGTITFTVIYTPLAGDDAILNTSLKFTGSTCSADLDIDIVGNPDLASITIAIDRDYEAIVGEIVPIKIYLKDGNKFDLSGTTEISADIKYDGNLLTNPQDYTPTGPIESQTITITKIGLLPKNGEQPVTTVNFEAANNGANLSTELEILNASGNGGAAFIPSNGLFTVNATSAVISIDTITKAPGESFDLIIRSNDAGALVPFNEGLLAYIHFNATLIEPPKSSGFIKKKTRLTNNPWADKDKWYIDLELPVDNGQDMWKISGFRAMFGNASEAAIIIDSLKTKVGKPTLTPANGVMKLSNLCVDGEDGKVRLFNPFAKASIIKVIPDPPDGISTIEYELGETGHTKIWISDILGNNSIELLNTTVQSGKSELHFDSSELPVGLYFIIMQTPTQVLRRKMMIVR